MRILRPVDRELIDAVREDRLPGVDAALAKGADPNAPGEDGWTALHHAVHQGAVSVAGRLLAAKASVGRQTPDGRSMLHLAARHRSEPLIETLHGHGAEVSAFDATGRTPLHYAAESGCPEVVRTLLRLGASLEAEDKSGATAFDVAIASEEPLTGDVLLEAGARGGSVSTAASRGSAPALRLLLDQPDARLPGGTYPLHAAVRAGHRALVEAFLARGALINQHEDSGATALHLAARGTDLEITRSLLQAGGDPLWVDEFGQAPLHVLRFDGTREHAQLLLGAVAVRERGGHTPFQLAVAQKRWGAAVAIFEAGTPELADAEGWTPRDWMAALGKTPAESRPHPGGLTVIHLAAAQGFLEGVRALVSAGAPVDAQDDEGNTPLHFAVALGHADVAQALRSAGARDDLPNAAGQTAQTLS